MAASFDPARHSHRRRNPLTDQWVLVSPQRNARPWHGQLESPLEPVAATYVADCYLCPGNARTSGVRNPDYQGAFAFSNDFPALTAETPLHQSPDPLFSMQAEQGQCRVVAYCPDHSQTLAEMDPAAIKAVIDCWISESSQLGARFDWVQVFENKGEMMGCSMPHPHGQIWAQTQPPTLLQQEHETQRRYFEAHRSTLLFDYAQRELSDGARTVLANDHWLVVVPFWAAWPFETLLLPRFAAARLPQLTGAQRSSLAEILSGLLVRYDNLFQCRFPYSMGWHSAPYDGEQNPHWQLHAHFLPPLLRSQSIRKFMVGYEMLAEPQRDLTPEQAAQILRELPARHFRKQQASTR